MTEVDNIIETITYRVENLKDDQKYQETLAEKAFEATNMKSVNDHLRVAFVIRKVREELEDLRDEIRREYNR